MHLSVSAIIFTLYKVKFKLYKIKMSMKFLRLDFPNLVKIYLVSIY